MTIAVFWIAFLGAAAVLVVVNRRRKLMALSSIRDAPDAERVRIAGTVHGESSLRAPVTGRRCTCYELSFLFMRGTRVWARKTHREVLEFQLTDPTGTASVPSERMVLDVSADHIENTAPRHLRDPIRAIVQQFGIRLDKITSISLYEAIIADGDQAEVIGSGLRRAIPDGPRERGFRDEPASLLELRGAVYVVGPRRPMRREPGLDA